MKIIPAIDILKGKVVRLFKGDYNNVTNYTNTPEQMAQIFYDDGAKYLHIVDLDGAKAGKAVNSVAIKKITQSYNMQIEVGGGIRNFAQIDEYLNCGAARIILGTAAVNDYKFLKECVKRYGNKIAVGVDAKNGLVAVQGWNQITDINSLDFCKKLADIGVSNVIYTDISKDGALNGTNLSIYEVLCQTKQLKITASGGITYLDEIKKLAKIGVDGAIIGKAIYDGKISLKETLAAAEGKC